MNGWPPHDATRRTSPAARGTSEDDEHEHAGGEQQQAALELQHEGIAERNGRKRLGRARPAIRQQRGDEQPSTNPVSAIRRQILIIAGEYRSQRTESGVP